MIVLLVALGAVGAALAAGAIIWNVLDRASDIR